MKLPILLRRTLVLCAGLSLHLASARAQEIGLLTGEHGVSINTSMNVGNGSFNLELPGIVIGNDIYKPLKPTVEVVDDKHLVLQYPGGAEIKVTIEEAKVTFACSGLPADASSISTKFNIARDAWQGAKFSFNESALAPFPEEDERKLLFDGKAKHFTFVDPAGAGIAITSPELSYKLVNKGPEGWSQFACFFAYRTADHPGESGFFLEFRPVNAP